MAQHALLHAIRNEYHDLFEASRHARYDGVTYTTENAREYLQQLEQVLAVPSPLG